MAILDSEGRVFGVVNLVDALVVLLVVAVAGVGLLLVVGPSSNPIESQTTHATLDLGTQPTVVAEAVTEGDSYAPTEQSNLTVTDVYLAPAPGGTRTLVRVRLTGLPSARAETTLRYAGAPPRLGRSLTLSTPRYNATGTIQAVGASPQLPTNETPVLARATLSADRAESLSPGTQLTVDDRPVATIQDAYRLENGSRDRQQVYVLANLSTYAISDAQFFANTELLRGASVTLPLASGEVSARVLRVAPDDGLGRETRQVLVTDVLATADATALAVGDTYRVADRAVGEVVSVTRYGTSDPERMRVYVGLALETLAYGDVAQFGETPLREGVTVSFRTATYTLEGRITRLDATEQRGTETTHTATLQLDNLSPERAAAISEGMTERANGETIATIRSVDREPATLVLTSESGDVYLRDHPTNEDLRLTVDLSVRATPAGLRFKGAPLQIGSTVTLDLGGQSVTARVVGL